MTLQPPGSEAELAQARAANREHYLKVVLPKLEAGIQTEMDRRGLASFMNRTRWAPLCKAVHEELPFPPPFQIQDMTGPRQVLWASDDVDHWGDWSAESLEPVLSIEWMRIVPRYLKHRGMLVAPEIIDCTTQLRDLVKRLRLPWREDERGIWIYGYAPADPATLTSPPEAPT
ncbi:DUF6678 family protein [Brevundimonas sp.]|uniref:DUF6678 family protein n=1 Tax=Brevundimonas sp. TaxID=1871086 RepID=UPI002D4DFF92|nr:DUF6678 family protein [Brevundimonas sp.]HYC75653.1 DUF6678 family protein [Brevundimonas sp.]